MSKVLEEKRFGKDSEFVMHVSQDFEQTKDQQWEIILDDYDQELTSSVFPNEETCKEAWDWGCILIDTLFPEGGENE